jgi:hypothetical protein
MTPIEATLKALEAWGFVKQEDGTFKHQDTGKVLKQKWEPVKYSEVENYQEPLGWQGTTQKQVEVLFAQTFLSTALEVICETQ